MGTGASKNKTSKGTFKQKASVAGKLGTAKNKAQINGHCHSPISQEILITDTSAAWEMLRQGNNVQADNLPKTKMSWEDFNKNVTRSKNEELDFEKSLDIPYDKDDEIIQEKLCHICEDTGNIVYPCRICTHVFHEECLHRIGQCQGKQAVDMLHIAKTSVGWSCHICDNLSNLLTEEEMFELMDTFDTHDLNKDSKIVKDEFMKYKRQEYQKKIGSKMTDEEENIELIRFKAMDKDCTDSIDWWEFLNYQSLELMQSRGLKNCLVFLLSRKEIQRARQTFCYFDKDGDGKITEEEAKEAYTKWYKNFVKEDNDSISNKNSMTTNLVQGSVDLIMSADTDYSHTVDWDEYLRDQAIFFISARPNSTNVCDASHLGKVSGNL